MNKTSQVPTREEIMQYNSVPVEVAAKYIGISDKRLRFAMQDERVPFGFVSINYDAKTYSGNAYTYNISPGLLVAYKEGTLPASSMAGALNILIDAIRDLVRDGKTIPFFEKQEV